MICNPLPKSDNHYPISENCQVPRNDTTSQISTCGERTTLESVPFYCHSSGCPSLSTPLSAKFRHPTLNSKPPSYLLGILHGTTSKLVKRRFLGFSGTLFFVPNRVIICPATLFSPPSSITRVRTLSRESCVSLRVGVGGSCRIGE